MRLVARAGLSGVVGLALALPLTAVAGTAATGHRAHPERMSHAHAKVVLDRARGLDDHADARVRRHGRPDATLTLRDLAEARASLTPTERTEADRILARPTDPKDRESLLHYPRTWKPATVETAHFAVHYDANTRDAGYTTPAQVQATEDVLEHVYDVEVGQLGYRAPLPDTPKTPSLGNPDSKVDVFLGEIGTLGYYGYCASDHPSSTVHLQPAYCVLDNDFAEFKGSRVTSLEVTVAHEFFHVIQAAYDFTEDVWLMEGSAVWMEDQVYDDANDYRQFVPDSAVRHPTTPLDYDDGGFSVYGTFLWFTYLSETLHDPAIVREIWEHAAARSSTDGGLYSIPAVRAALKAHGLAMVPEFASYAAWNTLPPASYSERAGWPGPALWKRLTLGRRTGDSGPLTTTLRHLSSATVRFAPGPSVPHWRRLRIVLDLPDTVHGSAATVQVRHPDGTDRVIQVHPNSHGNAWVVTGFDPARVRAVIVTVTNAGSVMRGCNSGSHYACGGYGVDDGRRFTVRGRPA